MITRDQAAELFRLDERLPIDQQPSAVYLSGLAAGSKPAMSQALNSTAQLVLKDDKATAYDIPWRTMRFQHVQKIRQDLEADENLSYSTVNKYLAAIRGTLKAAWKLGQMSSEDYYRAVSVENVKGERLLVVQGKRNKERTAYIQNGAFMHSTLETTIFEFKSSGSLFYQLFLSMAFCRISIPLSLIGSLCLGQVR